MKTSVLESGNPFVQVPGDQFPPIKAFHVVVWAVTKPAVANQTRELISVQMHEADRPLGSNELIMPRLNIEIKSQSQCLFLDVFVSFMRSISFPNFCKIHYIFQSVRCLPSYV
jgi:hypothetical protein